MIKKKPFTDADIHVSGNENSNDITNTKHNLLSLPENRARNPCVLLLMTSISWRVTV